MKLRDRVDDHDRGLERVDLLVDRRQVHLQAVSVGRAA